MAFKEISVVLTCVLWELATKNGIKHTRNALEVIPVKKS